MISVSVIDGGEQGSTLVELIVIIIVIAVLIAVGVPVYLNVRANARKRTCQTSLRTVDSAVHTYQSMFDDPVFPAGLSDMTQPGTRVLKQVPTCPSGTNSYTWVNSDPPFISCPNIESHTI